MKFLIAKLFSTRKLKGQLDIKDYNSLLLKPIGDAIGDSIVHIAHIKQIKAAFPNMKIGVLATDRCKAIYECSGIIDEILNNKYVTYLNQRNKWDLYLDFSPSFTSKFIICDAILSPKWIINFGKKIKNTIIYKP
ncbi:formamidopyrimidine-DNA glycosylase [Haemophilus parahaemolyticus]|uniref:glycosyltransferase family 9 protein n=1 Tax=Haemophilus parahaemolyticus TaxID=735 RepID=UPI0028E5C9FB|nr:formamidopyrimidine-DNA glycosylase [Haemophilus parahaemolyticus]